jgi:hypothetical protein
MLRSGGRIADTKISEKTISSEFVDLTIARFNNAAEFSKHRVCKGKRLKRISLVKERREAADIAKEYRSFEPARY